MAEQEPVFTYPTQLNMEDAMTSTESAVRALLDRWSESVRIKDIDQLMSLYAPAITYFDIVPPLQYTGHDAVRRNFLRWFDGWKSPIGVEICDLNITVRGDLAVAYMLHRTSGTLTNGQEVGYWVRATLCCQGSNDRWFVVV